MWKQLQVLHLYCLLACCHEYSHVTMCMSFPENIKLRTVILKLTHLVFKQLCSVHTTFWQKTRNCPSFNVCRVTSFSLVVCGWHKTALHISASKNSRIHFCFSVSISIQHGQQVNSQICNFMCWKQENGQAKESDFDKGQIVMVIWVGQSISKMASLMGCSWYAVVSTYRMRCEKRQSMNRHQGHGCQRLTHVGCEG